MRLVRTRGIDAFLRDVPDEQRAAHAAGLNSKWIDHSVLIALAKQHNRSLRDLARGSGVYFDPPRPPRPRSQTYEHFMAQLRAEQQEREYRQLVQESAPAARVDSSELKEVKEQLTTILNIMVSIVAIAWAFWHWTAAWDLAARTLVSLFAGIGIGIAEVVVYLGYKRRVREARAKDRVAKEKRSVVKKFVFTRGVEKTEEPALKSGSADVDSHAAVRSRKAAH